MLQTGLALAGKASELLNYGFQLVELMPSKSHPQSYQVSLPGRVGGLKKMAGSTTIKKNKKPSYGFLRNTEKEQNTVIVYRLLVSHLKMPELRKTV